MLYISMGVLRKRGGGGEIICILAKSITHFKCTTSKRSYQLCFLLCFFVQYCPILCFFSLFSLSYFTNCLYVSLNAIVSIFFLCLFFVFYRFFPYSFCLNVKFFFQSIQLKPIFLSRTRSFCWYLETLINFIISLEINEYLHGSISIYFYNQQLLTVQV